MNREQEEALAQTRYVVITAARASGVLLMLLGLWIWYGDVLREGGWAALGGPIFAVGFVESLILPQVLARRWRTPPER